MVKLVVIYWPSSPETQTRCSWVRSAKAISVLNPSSECEESIWIFFHQVALYCRQELNLRTTSNFLLAFCCLHKSCKIFVLKYFKATVVLPSDWMAIADFIQVSGTQGQFSKGLCCILLRAANRSRLVAFFNWSFRPLDINQWIKAFCEFGKCRRFFFKVKALNCKLYL